MTSEIINEDSTSREQQGNPSGGLRSTSRVRNDDNGVLPTLPPISKNRRRSLAYSSENTVALEEIAHQLERSLPCRNNRYKLRMWKNTFVGSECVDYLVRSKFASTRGEAVELGRRIASELNFFEHVTLQHELKDDYYFYRFTDRARRTSRQLESSSSEIKLRVSANLAAIASVLRREVDVRDRSYRLKQYRGVFVASDAITVMLEHNLVQSREEGVELGRRLEKEANLWHHVCDDHNFKDQYLFFRFNTPSQEAHNTKDDASVGPSPSVTTSIGDLSTSHLHSIAEQLRCGLRVRDRRYRFRIFKNCFVASEAIDFMIKECLAHSRQEAVDLARRLAKDFHLWYHVTNDWEFTDGYLFFRFAHASDQSEPPSEDIFTLNQADDCPSLSSEQTLSLPDVAQKVIRGVQVRDRRYKLRAWKKCFVGSELVDFLVQARISASRDDAIELGNQLMRESNLFEHVTKDHQFEDKYFFYRFCSSCEHTEYSMDEESSDLLNDESDHQSPSRSFSTEDLVDIGQKLRNGVRIKHRQYRLRQYKNCFVACEAVDYLVQSHITESRGQAVVLLRQLSSNPNLIEHVGTKSQIFQDEYIFFRFRTVDVEQEAEWGRGSYSTLSSSLTGGMRAEQPLESERLQIEWNPTLRKSEQQHIYSLQRSTADKQRVVFVGGIAGCGKSSLVANLFLDNQGIVFAKAKCSQGYHSAPLQALRLLFTDLCKALRDSPEFSRYLGNLKYGFDGKSSQQLALVACIPDMEGLFTELPENLSASKRWSENTTILQLAMCTFLKTISAVRPIVLCLDDIIWGDETTFGILHYIITRDDLVNILWCATYRNDDIDNTRPFTSWRKELDDDAVTVDHIKLNELGVMEIQAFLSNCLKQNEDHLRDLAELILERTHGNMFFIVQTLESLQDMCLLFFDYSTFRWAYSIETIRRSTRVADNVGDLLSQKIGQLPRDVQQVLKLASCFGTSFDPDILYDARSVLFVFDDIDECLAHACQEDLLIKMTDTRCMFAHDDVKDAAYDLLPRGEERQRIHWEIALKLSTKSMPCYNTDKEWSFTVADQLKLAGDVIHQEIRNGDRESIAEILYEAGESAAHLSAFEPASEYFQLAVTVLGDDARNAFCLYHTLAANIFLSYAKVLKSFGKVDDCRKIAAEISKVSSKEVDKRQANLLIYQCFVIESDPQGQIDFGLELLEQLGVKIIKTPNFVQASVEYDRSMKNLKKYSREELLGLPPMSDRTLEMAIEILCSLVQPGCTLRLKNFVSLVLAKLVQLTLQHGLCKYSPLILVLVGRDRIAAHNALKEGHEFAQLGISLQQVIPLAAEVEGTVLTEACMVAGCVEPLSKAMYIGLDAYKASMADGDTNNAFHGVSVYIWSFFYSGLPFSPLLEDVEKFATQMLEYQHTRWFYNTTPIFQLLLCLSGQEDDNQDIMSGKAVEMNGLIESKSHEDPTATNLHFYGLQLATYMGDSAKALDFYEKLKDVDLGLGKASSAYHVRLFFFALVCLQAYRQNHKLRFKIEAKKYIEIIRELVDLGAINLPQKLMLLEAEWECSANNGKEQTVESLRMFEKAAFAASRAGFLQDGALANFLCGQHAMRQGDDLSAGNYLMQSHSLYESWGANAVAAEVKVKFGHLFPESDDKPAFKGSGFRSRPQFSQSFSRMHRSLSRARMPSFGEAKRPESLRLGSMTPAV